MRTQLVKSDGDAISINYVLHDNDIAWQIRDVYLSGTISELADTPLGILLDPAHPRASRA